MIPGGNTANTMAHSRDSLPARNINRTSSYAPYHTHGLNRLSLVAEQPTPLATPALEKELQLQHISETEDILTGRTNSNASRRQSMMSTTSSYTQNNFQPSRTNSMRLDSMTRMDSTSRLNSMTSETSDAAFMPPPMRRRSLMTPGVATRVEDPSKYPLPRQKLQKEPPVARRMSVQPSVPVSNSSFFTKIRRSQTLPSDAESPDYYNSSEMPKETPEEILNRLQPLPKPTFRRSLELQRVNTPNDMGHIGGFKLGSLRITNGTVSPSATPKHVEKAREVDYFHLQRAALGATVQTVSDPNVRTLQAISTEKPTPAELSAVSPESATRPRSQGHSFSFEQTRNPIGDKYDDSKILELRPPPLSTADLAESYRLELDFTSPFYESLHTSPDELGAENSLPELSQTNGGLLTPGNGRRQGDELFLPESMKGSRPPSQENRLLQSVAQQASNGGLMKTDSGYSSHASLKSLQNGPLERTSPAPPSVPEEAPLGPPAKDMYVAYSAAKSVKSMESDRAPTVVMSPQPTEPKPPATPPKEKPSKADFWKTQHAPKTPKPISKVEDLTRKPVGEMQASPERAAPPTPQQEQKPKDAGATPKTRPPLPRPYSVSVSPQNTRDSVDTQAEREPIKVVRYTSVKEGPRPSLVENVPKRRPTQKLQKESTHKVLQKATGRPPLAVRARSQSNSAANAASVHKRSDSSDSLQSLKNMISVGSRRNSRSNSIDRTNLELPSVQKVTNIDSDYAIPVAPKMKDRSNRFSIGHAKNLWAESEEQKKEKENEKLEKQTEKVKSKQSKAAEKEKSKDEKKDKADKKEKESTAPSAEEIEKSIRLKSLAASTPSERALAMLSMGPTSSQKSWRQSLDMKSDASIKSNDSNREMQIRKEFEQEITSFENVAGSLGGSPYDVAMKATVAPGHSSSSNSSDSSLSTIKPKEVRPKGPMRDQSGRVVGMDEVSASQFARNRSQIRAMQQERRETLMALHGTPQDIDDHNQQRSFAPQIGNSSFAKQLAAQAGSSIGKKKPRPTSIGAAPDAPPLPTLNFDELKHKGLTGSKPKKALTTSSAGPPVSALNGVRKRNSGKGRQNMFGRHKELSTQIEMPERFAPLPPSERPTDSSASSISGSEASIHTPMSQPESSTSVSSNGSENSASQGKINAPVKQKGMVSLFPSIQVPPTGAGIDGILDAVLAPMTPSPTKTDFTITSSPNTPSFTISPSQIGAQSQPKPNIFGTRPPPPVSPSAVSSSLAGEQKPNIFGTRAPPAVSPSGSSFSSSTNYYTPQSHLSSSSSSHTFPPTGQVTTAPAVSSPLASPTRPRLQSAMSSRSSVGSSPSTFSVEKKRVAISTAPATILTPSMAPRWQGPSPAELAEMAMMAKGGAKEKRPLAGRSCSAQGAYDKGAPGAGKGERRPSSEQGVRPKNVKRRSFGLGGSKPKSSVEA